MKKIFFVLALGTLPMAFVSCDEDIEKAEYDIKFDKPLPRVTTGEVGSNFGAAVILSANVQKGEADTVVERGIIYGKKADLLLADPATKRVQMSTSVDGDFKIALQDLEDKSTYYYRAYATNGEGNISYGEIKQFVTDATGVKEVLKTEADFTKSTMDPNFVITALSGKLEPVYVPLAGLGINANGIVASCLTLGDVLLGKGGLAPAGKVETALSYKLDFNGMAFPTVKVQALNVEALLNKNMPGNFKVYLSEAPITKSEDLATAVLLGSSSFDSKEDVKEFSYPVPTQFFDKAAYVTVCNQSEFKGGGDLGIVLLSVEVYALTR